MATDTLYVHEAVDDLVDTLEILARSGRRSGAEQEGDEGGKACGQVLMAYGRNRWAEEAFLKKARRVFSIEEVGSAELDPLYQCEDVTVLRMAPLHASF